MAECLTKLFDEAELANDWPRSLAVFQRLTESENIDSLPDWLAVEIIWLAVYFGYGTHGQPISHDALESIKGLECWEGVLRFNKVFPLLDNEYLISQGIDADITDLSLFLAHPKSKSLSPHRLFNILYYQQTETPHKNHHPLVHFFRHSNGWQSPSVKPNPLFDIDWYRQTYLACQPHRHPLLHYLENFKSGGFQPSDCFDTSFIKNSQQLPEEIEPLSYYLEQLSDRWSEFCCNGFSPCPFFDRQFYLEHHPDIKSAAESGRLDPFYHFFSSGKNEGRVGHPWLRHDMFVPQLMPGFQSKRRTAVIILGMHRSGTSAITRTVNLLGMDLPSHLMEANFANEAGYWESDELARRYHDHMLADFASAWDDVVPVADKHFASEDWYRFRAALSHYVVKEFHGSENFVLKDPRMCKLARLWLEALADLHVELKVIIPFRNPVEVAVSLAERDGFSLEKSLLLWADHLLTAEKETRGVSRCFISYERLLSQPRQIIRQITEQCLIAWPNPSEAILSDIEAFIDPQLCHHRHASIAQKGDKVPDWVMLIEQALGDLTANPFDEGSIGKLDEAGETVRQLNRFIAAALAEQDNRRLSEAQHNRQKQDMIRQHAVEIQKLVG